MCKTRMLILFVVPDADVVAGSGEGVPGDVEPGGAGKEFVGEVVMAKEVDKTVSQRGQENL